MPSAQTESSPTTRTTDPTTVVGRRTKGLRLDRDHAAAALLTDQPHVTDAPFAWPLLTLDDGALAHNIALMARLCAEHGVQHAPHVKTTMSRQVVARQLAAGAWGVTVATPGQLRTVRSWGRETVFLANELVDPREIAWLRAEIEGSLGPGGVPFEVWLYVDSPEGVGLLARGFADAAPEVLDRLGVLVEVGVHEGRTGTRTSADTMQVARAVVGAGLRLLGVAGYEGSAAHGTSPEELETVAAWCRSLREAATALVRERLVPAERPVVVSAGGSSYLDVVLATLPGPVTTPDGAEHPTRVVVRSGAYVVHDHGYCARMDPWDRIAGAEPMRPAATVWAQVLSTPEPGLALCGAGRRDVADDIDLPTPLWLRSLQQDGTWSAPHELHGASVTGLNDQHLYLRLDDSPADRTPATAVVRPGDVVGFGISHPCTLLDRWRAAAVVRGSGRMGETGGALGESSADEVLEIVTFDF
ncbi:D-serine deaminase-like pyridoxal phosphate-dependent protein [Sediminihabitans luteus]|uniref:D-serine deaminase-like pyridoxal phosphate-dependent protein n=1 Tax=Sediminihabitans luteus TaxID=1138585 RepID=A0A2M9CDD6_9CELL|nr:alanine racemase [Sediminihabitans luteus]PJJ69941.1 D-serine deaminase-like pyridoxal phosphate-dependent protein [Sediminihabitans luteus]GII99261.1 alanine racemase [Sediminihabitans luteus]